MNTVTLNVRKMRTHSLESFQTMKDNWQILLLFLLFVCGLFCGCLMQKNNVYNAVALADSLVKRLTNVQWRTRLTPLLFEVIVGLLMAFFAGFNAVGLPVILCLPCAKGMVYGVLASRLYIVYQIKGVIFSLLVLFPFLAVETALLLVCLRHSMLMSSSLFSIVRSGSGTGERGEMKRYGVSYLITVVLSVFVILLQTILGGVVGGALLS